MSRPSPHLVSRLLAEAAGGNSHAVAELFTLVYDQLRRLASSMLEGEGRGHTLQPTALVHEAYLRLAQRDRVSCESRGQFLAVAAQAMRRILVDHARSKKRVKRGGGRRRVALDQVVASFEARAIDLVALDEALDRLAARDARKAKVVELRFFAGLGAGSGAPTLATRARSVRSHIVGPSSAASSRPSRSSSKATPCC